MVDSGRVVVSNLARQSLYTSDDRGAPKATAIIRHLVERCPSVVSLHFPQNCNSHFLVTVFSFALAGCTRLSNGNTHARTSRVS